MTILAVVFWFKHYSSLRSVFLGICRQRLDKDLEFFEVVSGKKLLDSAGCSDLIISFNWMSGRFAFDSSVL